jgi:hypothetical protein
MGSNENLNSYIYGQKRFDLTRINRFLSFIIGVQLGNDLKIINVLKGVKLWPSGFHFPNL